MTQILHLTCHVFDVLIAKRLSIVAEFVHRLQRRVQHRGKCSAICRTGVHMSPTRSMIVQAVTVAENEELMWLPRIASHYRFVCQVH